MAAGRIRYEKGEDGLIYASIHSPNNEELARTTDGYKRLAGATNGVDALREVLNNPGTLVQFVGVGGEDDGS